MSVRPLTRKLAWSAPAGVVTTGDYARYRVQSRSQPEVRHLVDVETLQCDCESATKGTMAQARAAQGYVTFSQLCPHLHRALAYHALAEIGARGPTQNV